MESLMSAELEQLIRQYTWHGQPSIMPGLSGMNNTTIMLKDERERYIVRIYNNHSDQQKLEFEHRMLQVLVQQPLSIAIPIPQINNTGSTISTVDNGKLAARYCYIEGERPSQANDKHLISLAEATAKLSIAFSNIKISEEPAYSPYYELAQNYTPLDEQLLLHLLGIEELAHLEEKLLLLQRERHRLEMLESQFKALPHQWIHGDINCSNALAVEDHVVAILDFEFVTLDLRAMELAVLLSELIKPYTNDITNKMLAMREAYESIVSFTAEELALLPELIKLRSVDVVMHFIQRYVQGLDSPSIVARMVEHAVFVITYVDDHMK